MHSEPAQEVEIHAVNVIENGYRLYRHMGSSPCCHSRNHSSCVCVSVRVYASHGDIYKYIYSPRNITE